METDPDKSNSSSKVLYLSYDGITDALGSSQVLPYLKELSAKGYSITLISFEKKQKFESSGSELKFAIETMGIRWHPLRYTKRPPVFSTIFDIIKLFRLAIQLHKATTFDIVHCRSYITAFCGHYFKKRFGTKFLFDIRGFWVEERIEGGIWNIKNPLYKLIVQYFKYKENQWMKEADHVVALTRNAEELIRKKFGTSAITVIPCCSDAHLFDSSKINPSDIAALRTKWDIQPNQFVLGYLGSIGTWYLLDEMLVFFKLLRKKEPNALFILLTPDDTEIIIKKAEKLHIDKNCLRVQEVQRKDLPVYLSLFSVSLCFVKPSFSKKASSPTKIGELLSMGIPIVCNSGIGDTDWLFSNYKPGYLLADFSAISMEKCIDEIPEILQYSKSSIRSISNAVFSLTDGANHYHTIYQELYRTKHGKNKKILFLAPYPFDNAPSQRFRFEQYFDVLTKQNYSFTFSSFLNKRAWDILYLPNHGFYKLIFVIEGYMRRLNDLFRAYQYDLVFIHREAAPLGPPFIEWILYKVMRKKIIFDFDDAIWLNNTSQQNATISYLKCHWKTSYIIKWSWKVSVGNGYLAQYAQNFNRKVIINPTTLKLPSKTKIHHHTPTIIIGWTGTHSTAKYLGKIIPVMQQLAKKHLLQFQLISNSVPNELNSFDFIEFKQWNIDSETEDLLSFDIGVMPLLDDEWSKGKCGFKALQYMALGIPVVASPVGVNKEIIQHGVNGFLADSDKEWFESIENLIENKITRMNMGIQGINTVNLKYSAHSNATNYLSLFN